MDHRSPAREEGAPSTAARTAPWQSRFAKVSTSRRGEISVFMDHRISATWRTLISSDANAQVYRDEPGLMHRDVELKLGKAATENMPGPRFNGHEFPAGAQKQVLLAALGPSFSMERVDEAFKKGERTYDYEFAITKPDGSQCVLKTSAPDEAMVTTEWRCTDKDVMDKVLDFLVEKDDLIAGKWNEAHAAMGWLQRFLSGFKAVVPAKSSAPR